jgi:hypothetical protein
MWVMGACALFACVRMGRDGTELGSLGGIVQLSVEDRYFSGTISRYGSVQSPVWGLQNLVLQSVKGSSGDIHHVFITVIQY